MSEAYRIKRFHHVTQAKQKRLRDEKLVPLMAQFPFTRVMSEEVDDLLSTDEAMALKMDEIDALEGQLYTIQNLIDGDWLIDYVNSEQPAYIMKFERYSYHQHRHLYIKHFAHVSHIFKVKSRDMPEEVLEPLTSARHLQTLPLSVSSMFDKYELLASAQEQQEQVETRAKEKPHKIIKRRSNSRNGEVRIVRVAYRKP